MTANRTPGAPELLAADVMSASAKVLAAGAAERQAARGAELPAEYQRLGVPDLTGDTVMRIQYLAAALFVRRPVLFFDHVSWQKAALAARGIGVESLATNLECLEEEVSDRLPDEAAAAAADYLSRARAVLTEVPAEVPSLLEGEGRHLDLARQYLLAVLEARRDDAVSLLTDAVAGGAPAPEVYRDVIMRAQAEIGRMWQRNEVHVAEEHLGSRVAELAMTAVSALAPRADANGRRVLCTSTAGDLHDFGVRAVADHLEWSGYDALMLGASTPSADLMLAISDFEADLVVVSASLSLHLRALSQQIDAVRQRPEFDRVPIMVGGAPFARVDDLWQVVGADGHALDFDGAVKAADDLLRRRD